MSIITEVVDNFTGGMSEDIYNSDAHEFEIAKHIDTTSQFGRMRTQLAWRDGNTSGSDDTNHMIMASDGKGYGLGINGTSVKIYDTDDTAVGAKLGDDWDTTDSYSTNIETSPNMFFESKKNLYWWGNDGTNWRIDSLDLDVGTINTGTWNITLAGSLSFPQTTSSPGPGIHFDVANYSIFTIDNYVMYVDEGAQTPFIARGLVLDDKYEVVSLTEWDKYLVIGCVNKSKKAMSRVFFWDGFSALPNFFRDVPDGNLKAIRTVGTTMVAITTSDAGNGQGIQTTIYPSLKIFISNGGDFNLQKNIISRDFTEPIYVFDRATVVHNGHLYFLGHMSRDNEDVSGVYRFGWLSNQYSLNLDYELPTGNNSISTFASLLISGDYVMTTSGPTYTCLVTTKTQDHSQNGVYRTRMFDAGTNSTKKRLLSFQVVTIKVNDETINPATQEITAAFRLSEGAAWTTFGTSDTSSEEFHEFAFENHNIDVEDYRNIQFQVTMAGLVEITEVRVIHDVESNIYG